MRCDACVWNAKRRVLNLLTRYDTRQKHIDLLRTACPAAPTTSELRRPHQRHERSSPPRRACISCSALVDVAAGSSPDVENPTSGGDLGPSGSTLGPPSGAQNAIGKWRTVLFLTDKGESRGESRFPQEKTSVTLVGGKRVRHASARMARFALPPRLPCAPPTKFRLATPCPHGGH